MLRCPRWPLFVLLCLGCSEARVDDASTPSDPLLVYDLLDYADVAVVDTLEGVSAPREPFEVVDGALRQSSPTVASLSFAVPAGCRFVARGELRFRGEGPRAGKLTIEAVYDGGRRSLLDHRLDAGGGLDVDVDIGFLGGRLARIRLVLVGPTLPGSAAEVVWSRLQIRRSEAPPAEPSADAFSRRPFNVLFVLFDTLRADRTEPYAAGTKTPAIAALARKGVTFANATTNSAWTLPSVASIFTGTYPSLHGVTSRVQFREVTVLSDELPTLAETLADAGYRSVAVVNNPIMHPAIGLTRGFDELYEYYDLRDEVLARQPRTPDAEADFVWDTYLASTIEGSQEAPFFAYVHELDPHHPFDPPPPFDEMYGTYEGSRAKLLDPDLPSRFQADPRVVGAAQLAFLRQQYAGEVTFMDRYLGRLLERLETAGKARDTLVVFSSDHGEALGQHQRLAHGDTLYEEVLRVPLLMSLPGQLPAGLRVEASAELVDVAPTVLDLLGVPVPANFQGRSLLPWITAGQREAEDRPIFAKTEFQGTFHLDSVRYGRWKLIRKFTAEGAAPELALYDLRSDSGERRDRAASNDVAAGALRQMLDVREREDRARGVEPQWIDLEDVDSRTPARLRALGYME